MENFAKLLSDCETALREGQGHLVSHALADLRVAEIPRTYRLPLASICRRVNLLSLGMKILTPLTGPERAFDPTPSELAEYAGLLERSGAVSEALRILAEIDVTEVPEAPLYRAFCHFKSWDYAAAIPDLNLYIKNQPTPYWKLVGQVNLAAALVSERQYDQALDQLNRNIELAEQHDFLRLKGNCFEIRAQIYLRQKNYSQTREDLNEASRIFAFEQTFDQFFVHKWQTVLKSFEDGDTMGLFALRSEALARRDWESAREADLFRLEIKHDERLLNHLYFGTPFAGYRRRIEATLGRKPSSTFYIYGDGEGHVLDLSQGVLPDVNLKRGKLLHQTMAALCRDLYRPLRVGGLFAEVFPDERFDIYSSPGRVHHLQFRLRQFLLTNQVPAALQETDGSYALVTQPGFGIKLELTPEPVAGWIPEWNRLAAHLDNGRPTTAAEVRCLLALKPSTCKRFLKWATESGRLTRHGENNRSHYQRVG